MQGDSFKFISNRLWHGQVLNFDVGLFISTPGTHTSIPGEIRTKLLGEVRMNQGEENDNLLDCKFQSYCL